MLVKTYGAAVYGVDAIPITIEVNIDKGATYSLVGLPDNAIKESKERIHAALNNNGYKLPRKGIVINMAPADIKKEGSAYDLPIALGLLAASDQISSHAISEYVIMGELALDGTIRAIQGALPITLKAKESGYKGVLLPAENAKEAAVVDGIEVYAIDHLKKAIQVVNGESVEPEELIVQYDLDDSVLAALDFADVKGQENVKRGLEIAAAGGHNVILIGPPGVGKTMLAKRIPSILPPMTMDEALETTKIHSVAGLLNKDTGLIKERPFRNPHHTVSDVALVGGGSNPKPGEISLAHNGVLFLDELPEFKRTALEVMRQPLEDRSVTISRAKMSVDYPSSVMLVASMNPSPSGDFFDPATSSDSAQAVQRYLGKVSGPLLDRIDLHIEVNPVPFEELHNQSLSEKSSSIRKRAVQAREIQNQRFVQAEGVHSNAQMTPQHIKEYCATDAAGTKILETAVERMGFSARSYHRILKVARTIADLEKSLEIQPHHIAEAIQFRTLDREGFNA